MDFSTLRKAFVLIAQGLFEKEQLLKKAPERYPYSPKLQHGINLFLAASRQLGNLTEENVFQYADESSFCSHYLTMPISDWFEGWALNAQEMQQLEESPFYNYGEFAYCTDTNTYCPSVECREFLETQDMDAVAGTDQRMLYEMMMKLNQELYSEIRRFIIENPILSPDKHRKMKMKYSDHPSAIEALSFAYEEFNQEAYKCPVCGWTMLKGKYGLICHSPHCTDVKPLLTEEDKLDLSAGPVLRLKEGIMRYFAQPGKLELEIANFCQKKKLSWTLWPEMDRYDVEIRFPDGDIWEIDAKAYHNPVSLRNKIRNDNGFPSGDYQRGFFVVPTQYTRKQRNYTSIVNNALSGQPDVKCVTLYKLKQEITGKVGDCCAKAE